MDPACVFRLAVCVTVLVALQHRGVSSAVREAPSYHFTRPATSDYADVNDTSIPLNRTSTTEPPYYQVDSSPPDELADFVVTNTASPGTSTTEPPHYRVDFSGSIAPTNFTDTDTTKRTTTTEPSYYRTDPSSSVAAAHFTDTNTTLPQTSKTEPSYYRVHSSPSVASVYSNHRKTTSSRTTTTEPSYYRVNSSSRVAPAYFTDIHTTSSRTSTTTEPSYYRVNSSSSVPPAYFTDIHTTSSRTSTTTEPSYYRVNSSSSVAPAYFTDIHTTSSRTSTTTEPSYYRVNSSSSVAPAYFTDIHTTSSRTTTSEPSYYRVDSSAYFTDINTTSPRTTTTTEQSYYQTGTSTSAEPAFSVDRKTTTTGPLRNRIDFSPTSVPATPDDTKPSPFSTQTTSCVLPQYPQYASYSSPVCQYGNSTYCGARPGAEVPDNWVLLFTCREGYQLYDGKDATHVYCVNGVWYPRIPNCRELCGWKDPCSTETEDSWHVSILHLKNEEEIYCSGTLISSHIVLTGANCLVDGSTLEPPLPSEVKVAIGGANLTKDDVDNEFTQSQVRAIAVAPSYFGFHSLYTHNLALLDLKNSVTSMPACIDWHQEVAIGHGDFGTVTVRSRTENGTHVSDTVTRSVLTYINKRQCLFDFLYDVRQLLQPDKLCAVDYEVSGTDYHPDEFDGAGLIFEKHDLHYLVGTASNSVLDYLNRTQIVFTNVTNCELLSWIVDTKRTFDEYHNLQSQR